MSEFTKGPWSVEHSRMSNGILEEDEAISICTDDSHCWDICAVWEDIHIGDAKANANLIAAAPDMYEALMAIKNDLLDRANSDSDDMKVVACGSSVWVQIQDALAKARGEL